MAYLKTFDMALLEIARHLRAELGRPLDLVEGSDVRSLIEAVAFQVADLSERQERAILEAIPESTFQAFGFARLPPSAAQGALRFFTPVPAPDVILIPAGTEALDDQEQVFVTTADAFIAPGETEVDVPAIATQGGASGNISALAIVRLGFGVPGIQSVSNPTPFTGGTDPESIEMQTIRFANYVAGLHRSSKLGIAWAVSQASANGEGVTDALVIDHDDDPAIAPAFVVVLVYRRGGFSPELKQAVQEAAMQAKAGGVVVQHEWTNATLVDVDISVNYSDLTQSTQVQTAVQLAIGKYFGRLQYGEKVSYENLIARATDAHPLITEVKIPNPSADVLCGPRQRLDLGNLNITLGGA